MKPYTAIIVDDEQEARDLLQNIIADHLPEVKVLADADSADEAIGLILTHKPDIVFLDIEMPVKDGFEVARSISQHQLETTIIFVTAFNRYAIEAIKLAAFDYLLKPVNISELKACMARLHNKMKTQNLQQSVQKLLNCLNAEKLAFHSHRGYLFIDPATIVYCEAEGNYTDLYLADGSRRTVSMGLSNVETLLDGRGFARISRSVLINKKFLYQVNRKDKKCILKTGDTEFHLDIKGSFARKFR